MKCVLRYEYYVAGRYDLDLLTHLKLGFPIENHDDLIVC